MSLHHSRQGKAVRLGWVSSALYFMCRWTIRVERLRLRFDCHYACSGTVYLCCNTVAICALFQPVRSLYLRSFLAIVQLNNGILSGLVAISASGPLVEAEGAFIVGMFASAFYLLGVWFLFRWVPPWLSNVFGLRHLPVIFGYRPTLPNRDKSKVGGACIMCRMYKQMSLMPVHFSRCPFMLSMVIDYDEV